VPVPISASARWVHELTDVRIRAVVTDPSGGRTPITLSDQLAGGGGSGQYAGTYDPTGTAGAARLVQGEGRRG